MDSPTFPDEDIQTSKIIKRINGKLFSVPILGPRPNSPERSDNVVLDCNNTNEGYLSSFAVTINPDPFLNISGDKNRKRLYGRQSNVDQREFLNKLLDDITTVYPEVNFAKICFEVCPKSLQVHVHCLLECPQHLCETLEKEIYQEVSRKNSPSWRSFQMDPIYNRKGWINYIMKAQK